MAKVLWVGDPFWRPSGYGTALRDVIKYSKLDLACIGSIHFGNPITCDGVTTYGRLTSEDGYDALPSVINKEKPEFVVTVKDIGLQRAYHPILNKYENIKWLPYIPVDSLNIPGWANDCLDGATKVITMSKYGQKRLKTDLGINARCIPLGCDLSVFKPTDKMGLFADKFVVLSVGINQERKHWYALLKAFSIFAKDKTDVVLMLHTDVQPFNYDHGGWELPLLMEEFGITDKCVFTDNQNSKYWRHNITPEMMARVYNSADIALFGGSEGFGLPIIEAQACGKPIVMGDQCTAEELVGTHGLRVPINSEVCGRFGTRFGVPSIDGLADAMNKYYNDRKLLSRHSFQSFKHAQKYDAKKMALMWGTVISEVYDK